MLRVVVAVALATALLGAAMPAVETARVDHAEGRVDAEIRDLAGAATRLAERNDPAPPGIEGARRPVTVHAPGQSWAAASLAYLTVPGPSSDHPHGVVRYRVEGGPERTRVVSAPLVGPEGGLTLSGGGSRRVVLELDRWEGESVVVVLHPEFKSDGTTSAGHDSRAASARRPVRCGKRRGLWL